MLEGGVGELGLRTGRVGDPARSSPIKQREYTFIAGYNLASEYLQSPQSYNITAVPD